MTGTSASLQGSAAGIDGCWREIPPDRPTDMDLGEVAAQCFVLTPARHCPPGPAVGELGECSAWSQHPRDRRNQFPADRAGKCLPRQSTDHLVDPSNKV